VPGWPPGQLESTRPAVQRVAQQVVVVEGVRVYVLSAATVVLL